MNVKCNIVTIGRQKLNKIKSEPIKKYDLSLLALFKIK